MEEHLENPKPKILVVIDADPRSNPRPAEAVRTAGGVSVWQQVEMSVVLRGPAAAAGGVHRAVDRGRQFRGRLVPSPYQRDTR